MATQYTSILKLALPVQGELSGTWGDVVNNNITSMVEEAIAGRKVINTWSSNSHTLTSADGTTAESRAAILTLTDTGSSLTGAGTVICPAASKVYIVENGTGRAITVKTASGTGIAVPNGKNMVVFCDATNVEEGITNINSLTLNGDGATVSSVKDEDNMASNSATALATQQSIKAYVDSQVATSDTLAEVLANGNTTGGTNVELTTTDKVQFRDTAIYLNSSADGQLDIVADTEVQIAATTIDINGNVDISGTAGIGGVLTANAGVVVDNITIDGQEIDVSSGNLTLDVAGETVIDSGSSGILRLKVSGTDYGMFFHDNTHMYVQSNISDGDMVFRGKDGGSTITALTLDMSEAGEATFNSDILLGDGKVARFGTDQDFRIGFDGSTATLQNVTSDSDILFKGNDGGSTITALTLDMSAAGAATFNSTVTSTGLTVNASGGRQYINSGHLRLSDGYNIEWGGGTNFLRGNNSTGAMSLTATGDLTLDASGDIILDADGADIIFADGGTQFGFIGNSSSNLVMKSQVQDKDIVFKGNDGGSTITALTLDMSDGGEAYFAKNIHATSAFLTTANNDPQLTLISTDADASSGPVIKMYRNSGSPADSDQVGRINFTGRNDNSQDVDYARIITQIKDASDGTEDGRLAINTIVAGEVYSRINIIETETVFNDESLDLDFRVESDSNDHMLFVDGGNNRVGVGTSSPSTTLHLSGLTGSPPKLTLEEGGAESRIYVTKNSPTNSDLRFQTEISGTIADRMIIDYSGNLLVGKTAQGLSNAGFEVAQTGQASATQSGASCLRLNRLSSDGEILQFRKDGSTVGSIASVGGADIKVNFSSDADQYITGNAAANYLSFSSANAERMRIDSSGTLNLGTTLNVFGGADRYGYNFYANGQSNQSIDGTGAAVAQYINRENADGPFTKFYKDRVEVGSIFNSGTTMGVGSLDTGVLLANNIDAILPWNASTNAERDAAIDLGRSAGRFKDLYLSGTAHTNQLRLKDGTATTSGLFHEKDVVGSGTSTNPSFFAETGKSINFMVNGSVTKAAILDASGNLLVGQTSNSETGTGIGLVPDGTSHMYSASTDALMLGRGGSDGDILSFNKSGTSVGSIGTSGGLLVIGDSDCGIAFEDGSTNHIYPWNVSGGAANNDAISLGANGAAFKDLYLSGVSYNGDGSDSAPSISFGADTNTGFYRVGSDQIGFVTGGGLKAKLDASGNLLLNDTTASAKLWVNRSDNGNTFGARATASSYASTVGFFGADRNTTNGTFHYIDCYNYGSSTYRFRVADSGNVTNTNNSYGAISDVKLKENIVDATPKLDKLNEVRVVNYNFIGSEEKQLGVIAQELEQIMPNMVDENVDTDADGNDLGTTTKTVKYSVFVPMLIKAMQEQTEIINDLRARVAQLEGAN